MTNPNDPIAPVRLSRTRHVFEQMHEGLTKREYFAAMAMQALLTHTDLERNKAAAGMTYAQAVAFSAVECADDLVAALNGNSEAKEPET